LGDDGATATFGPQKGLLRHDVPRLDAAMAGMAQKLARHTAAPLTMVNQPGTGAAGGRAAGFLMATNARLLAGFDFVAACLDLKDLVSAADWVITGEGRFDESSLRGKGPGSIVRLAREAGKPVVVVAGLVEVANPPPGVRFHALSRQDEPLGVALPQTATRLSEALQQIGHESCRIV
jgi:glycerate kinase